MTFVNRVSDSYRDYHAFIRSIPTLKNGRSKAKIVTIDDAAGQGYKQPPKMGTWKDHFTHAINGTHNPTQVHFIGRLDHSNYLRQTTEKLGSCIPHDFLRSQL